MAVILLAAGKGTRLRSDLPKALHSLCGVPMLRLLLDKVRRLRPAQLLVVAGYRSDLVRRAVGPGVKVVIQKRLLGSGHAVAGATRALSGFKGLTMVLYCDTPLISVPTLKALVVTHRKKSADCTLLSVSAADPTGYGRIRRGADGRVEKIVEDRDASLEEKAIREVNVGCYVFGAARLFEALSGIRKNPGKKEYYLTDAVGILSAEGRVEAVLAHDREEALGINTRLDLANLEQLMQKRILEQWIEKGVRIRDLRTTTIDADVKIGEGTQILPHTVIEGGSLIGKNCVIGPFARIRGGSRIGDRVIVGNFVEIVRSVVGDDTQIKHLSYLGDARVGKSVNVGAGALTANFDGRKKSRTVIKDKALIGSGTILIAPVIIGRSARTGAGAVVTKGKNVPDRGVVVGVPARTLSSPRPPRRVRRSVTLHVDSRQKIAGMTERIKGER